MGIGKVCSRSHGTLVTQCGRVLCIAPSHLAAISSSRVCCSSPLACMIVAPSHHRLMRAVMRTKRYLDPEDTLEEVGAVDALYSCPNAFA
jgi:hypothetical protein